MNESRQAGPDVVPIESARSALPPPPLEINVEDLPRKTLGYNPRATADLFEQVADTYRRLWDDRSKIEKRLEKLQAELAEERQRKGNTSADAAVVAKLEKADASRRQLALQLEQATSALADSRAEESRLSQHVSELETELRTAEERTAAATDRFEQANKELERFREQERALAEALVWARHTASELSENAEQQAKQTVEDAERKAAELLAEGRREVERLSSERDRLETLANEFQDDLSVFLLGTLERLKERAGSGEAKPNESAPDATGDGGRQRTVRTRRS